MADPTAVMMEGFGVLFIPLIGNFSWIGEDGVKLAAFFRKRYISKLTTHFCTLSTLTGGTFILLSCTVNLKR